MYKIMVIEDHEKIRFELCEFLNKNGYKSIGINDFEHVLEQINQHKPELLLLDLTPSLEVCTMNI